MSTGPPEQGEAFLGVPDVTLGETGALGESILEGRAEGRRSGRDAAGAGAQVDASDIGAWWFFPVTMRPATADGLLVVCANPGTCVGFECSGESALSPAGRRDSAGAEAACELRG